MSTSINDENLWENYETIWTNIEKKYWAKYFSSLWFGYISKNIRTYGDKVYNNFRSLNVPKACIQCECFTDISIDSSLVYESKYYLQIYLDNCDYKIANKQTKDYLDDNFFETD